MISSLWRSDFMKRFFQSITWVPLLLCITLLPSSGYGKGLIAFGDSITQGVPYLTAPSNGARNGGYEPFLEEFFLAIGHEHQVYNWGLAGDTTQGALTGASEHCEVVGEDEEGNPIVECYPVSVRTVDQALESQGSADYLLIMEGTNDFFLGISPQTTAINLCEIAARGKAYGLLPLIATVTPDFRETGKSVELLNAYIIPQAENCGVKIVDLYSGLVDNWSEYVSPDYLHPNLHGYKAIANIWFDMFYNLQLTTGKAVDGLSHQNTARITLKGSASADGTVYDLAFEYGPNESMEKRIAATPENGDGTATLSVSAELDGLKLGARYYYRLTSTLNGVTYYGETKTFVTPEFFILTGAYLLLL